MSKLISIIMGSDSPAFAKQLSRLASVGVHRSPTIVYKLQAKVDGFIINMGVL